MIPEIELVMALKIALVIMFAGWVAAIVSYSRLRKEHRRLMDQEARDD